MCARAALLAGIASTDQGQLLIASADADGTPHIATADSIRADGPDQLLVTAWFCSATIENLDRNPRLALLAWTPEDRRGHQVVGEVERIDEVAMLDGYVPDHADGGVPQVQRRLLLRVDQVLVFADEPHRDQPAEG